MKRALTLLIAAGMLAAFPNWGTSQPANEASEEITLYAGQMKPLTASTPSRVAIANPGIADVISVAEQEIVVAGKAPGTTKLLWWDEAGEHSARLRVLAEDMTEAQFRVDSILKELDVPKVFTRKVDSEGKVLLLGSVKTQADADRIKTALGLLYSKCTDVIAIDEEKAIVQLEVEVLEIDRGANQALGMKWLESSGAVGAESGAITLAEPANWSKRLSTVPSALFKVSEWQRDTLGAKISLLVQEGKARVLSRPKLACQSGKEANLLVGGEKPIMTTEVASSSGASSTTVDYKEYGIKLKMKPVISADRKINLGVNVDISEIGEAEILGSLSNVTAKAYPITKRSTSTQLVLNNAQTLAISGLIRQKTEEQLQKFPWLADIPVLGVFFRSKTTTHGGGVGELGDTELVIMITPTILNEPAVVTASKEEPAPAAAPAPMAAQTPQQQPPQQQAAQPQVSTPVAMPASAAAVEEKAEPVEMASADIPLPISPVPDEKIITARYVDAVTKFIGGQITYPSLATRAKIEGTVSLALHIAKQGKLLDAVIGNSSGYAVLDENALSVAKNISPYPAFPADINKDDMWIRVPIVYTLSD